MRAANVLTLYGMVRIVVVWDDVITVPGWDELIAVFLSRVARWVFGSGVILTIVIGLISAVMVVRGVIDLYRASRAATHEAGRLAVGAVEWGRGVAGSIRKRLSRTSPVMVVFNVTVGMLMLSLQGLWLVASWGISDRLSELWNAYTGSSRDLPVGVPWQSFTGYYTIICAVLLLIAWLVRDVHIGLATWAAFVPVLSALPLFIILVIGTPLNLAYSMLVWLPRGAAAWEQWDGLGELWLYIVIIAAYCATTFAAMKLADYGTRPWRAGQ